MSRHWDCSCPVSTVTCAGAKSSVETFSRLCEKSVVLYFFVLVQYEASVLMVFLHLDFKIFINSFL